MEHFFTERNMQEVSQRHLARTVAVSNSRDIRVTTGLTVALSNSVQC